ncbi:DEAD/DEAH box helicase family protein [Calidifontibacillus oryziterrae]|uniref:DEAD/DEAH box helicase family protein n=1 Tax=Calidifontibacillus oryziterrae TaxID=1191699 RepID=UPI000308FD91|nr:DEAD/DEAH box helicase family protein [Calidifontibacillus oryziterrae]
MKKIELVTENIIEKIVDGIEHASTIYILTAFIMKSGVELLKPYLEQAAKRGADIKICTGDYLYITQPDGLKELIEIHDEIEVRMWKSNGVSFHPKAYIFQNDQDGTFIVGSSNLSRSALTTGVEWNLAMKESAEPMTFQEAMEQFIHVFHNEQTIPVNNETIKIYEKNYENFQRENPKLAQKWSNQEEKKLMFPIKEEQEDTPLQFIKDPIENYTTIKPLPVQEEALISLHQLREEGYDKAMVVLATGLGKTYLAAFFAQSFHRILFVAHREEILHQAKRSFERVIPSKSTGLFYGPEKNPKADIVFASVVTLSMKKHLKAFQSNTFDLIIIDEFHHAAATTYQGVLEYFNSKFLLGITATPDRLDNKDIYGLCDGNVAYQMHFTEAIEKQWLTPFKYYGVYDETDYSKIKWLGTKYDREELLAVQLRNDMAEKILNAWKQHKQTRTLVFCSSIKQATNLSNYFNNQGYQAVALHSGQLEIGRKEAITMLENGKIDAIFTVDLFNEGVDIPSVDTLLFVRPTESLTVFTQQVGRGLRRHQKKTHCTIIDLIGNYRNADLKLRLFDTGRNNQKKTPKFDDPIAPEWCEINLELGVINLLKELAHKRQPRKEKLLNTYHELKEELGRRPSYLELHLYGKSESKEYKQEFKSYAGFLHWADELTNDEKQVYKKYKNWLEEVESTSMTKSYKMVVLLAMLNREITIWHLPITAEQVAPFFKEYYQQKKYRMIIEFSNEKSKGAWLNDKKQILNRIETMPMTKWSGSSKGLMKFTNGKFQLSFEIDKEHERILYGLTKEICEFRLHEYFERKERL